MITDLERKKADLPGRNNMDNPDASCLQVRRDKTAMAVSWVRFHAHDTRSLFCCYFQQSFDSIFKQLGFHMSLVSA